MAGNAQEPPPPPTETLNTARTWTMADGLQKDLCIDGVDIGSGRQGFQVVLPITWAGGFSASLNLTLRIRDDTAVIAEDAFEMALPPGGNNDVWNLNFTSGRVGCMVLRGHKLSLEAVVTATGTASAWVSNVRNAHIAFRATDPLLPTVHTENRQGPASTFYPNDVDGSRDVVFNGTLGSAFTDAFVSAVRVTVKAPGGTAVHNATGTVSSGNWTYTWQYPRSTPGLYTADIQVEDTQAHLYNTSVSFTFVAYGLRIDAQDASGGAVSRYTTQGACAAFDLTVTNVGGSATGALLLTEATPPPLWRTNFTRTTLPLDPGAANVSTFNVCPDGQLGPGNSSQITVLAIANDDPAPIKARATIATTTVIEREIFLVIAPPATDASVKLGGLASYDFTITNNGGLSTDVLLDATAAPGSWVRTLSGPAELTPDGAGWRLAGLAAGGSAVLTLDVQAPPAASPDTTFACTVTARSVENASAVATFVATTHLVLGIEIAQTSLPEQPEASPGDFVDFQFELRNTDPLSGHTVNESDITVAVAAAPAPAVGSPPAVAVQAPVGCCDATGSAVLTVTVTLDTQTRAGRYTFTLSVVYDNDPGKVASLNFSLLVRQVTAYSLVIDGKPSQVVMNRTGSTVLHGTLVSLSNYPVSVDLEASVMQGASPDSTWTVRVLDAAGGELPGRVVLQPYAELRVALSIAASSASLNGEHRDLAFRMSLALSGQNAWNLAPVDLVVDLDTMAVVARMWQQSFLVVLLFGLLAAVAASMARRALRGPAPPKPPPAPAAARPAAGSAAGPGRGPTSAAAPPKK
jgi:hypothetical protein